MVRGMDVFRENFAEFQGSYVLIGGVACELVLDEAGIDFRGTKDLDIVLCVEALEPGFIQRFWQFIEEGGYTNRERSDGEKQFYRFSHPENSSFPYMLELFSRTPEGIELPVGSQHTPIPPSEELSSLSALLLDEDYYRCIKDNSRVIDDIPILGTAYLIPFKVRAWLDLTERKVAGESVDSRDIRKHRNDIFRLYPLLTPGQTVDVPGSIYDDVVAFIEAMRHEEGLDIRSFGIKEQTLLKVLAVLREMYRAEQAP